MNPEENHEVHLVDILSGQKTSFHEGAGWYYLPYKHADRGGPIEYGGHVA